MDVGGEGEEREEGMDEAKKSTTRGALGNDEMRVRWFVPTSERRKAILKSGGISCRTNLDL